MTTIPELEEAIKNYERIEFGRRGGFWNEFDCMAVVDIEIGHIQYIEESGVASDESGRLSIVFSFTAPDSDTRYFMKHGYHSSWDGNDWDGTIVEVEKKEVIKYEWRVKR